MLIKQIGVVLLCGLILAGTIFYTATFRFFDRPLTESQREEFREQIHLPDRFTLAASVNSYDTVKNTLQGARKNVREGAYALELNVAFDENGVPYLADGKEYITAASVQLESVLQDLQDAGFMRYILNLQTIPQPGPLIDLASRYDLIGRMMLRGFTEEDLERDGSQFCNFYLGVSLEDADLNLSDHDACAAFLEECVTYGASAVSCTLDHMTQPLREALDEIGDLRLILTDVNSEYAMYHALSYNPNIVITEKPNELYNMMLSHDYLDLNKDNVF